jgi:hypothetical protein
LLHHGAVRFEVRFDLDGERIGRCNCGVHCFARGHLDVLGGDYVSVNLNALDGVDVDDGKVVYWDGRHDNWQAGPRNKPWPTVSS